MAKIGTGHAGAMGRKGLTELRNAVYPESNITKQDEYGLYGTLTPGEVAADRQDAERDHDEEPTHGSVLASINRRLDRGREGREHEEPEMERD